MSRKLIFVAIAIFGIGGVVIARRILSKPTLPPGFVGVRGRLEVREVDMEPRYSGRVKQIFAHEGETVDTGQVLATMDTEALDAELRDAEARIQEAEDNYRTALTEVDAKQSEFTYSAKQYERSKVLVTRGAVSEEELDRDSKDMETARAALLAAKSQSMEAQSSINAAIAEADRLKAMIKQSIIRAPVRGRVMIILANPGETLPSSGKILTLDDLGDVYLYIFLPMNDVGKVPLGAEARIVLDNAPDYPIKATVSYVEPIPQFSAKPVQTAEERQAETYRLKLRVNRRHLGPFEANAEAGIPCMGYVRLDNKAQWPPALQWKPVSPEQIWSPAGQNSQ